MKLEDVTVQELLDSSWFWSDFEEDPNNRASLWKKIESDPSALVKVNLLDQMDTGTLLDRDSFHRADFYEVDFNDYARLFLAKGEYSEKGHLRGKEIDYLRDYSGIKLLIQDLGDVYALYLKDYEFGFIRPLGMCIYECYPEDERELTEKYGREAFIRDHVLLELENVIWEDDFDLKQELYDYYHNIPDINSPLIEAQMDIEGLLTSKEASEKLGVSLQRIKQMVDDRLLDGYKFGSKLLITSSSVDQRLEYIKNHGGKKPTRGKPRKQKPVRKRPQD